MAQINPKKLPNSKQWKINRLLRRHRNPLLHPRIHSLGDSLAASGRHALLRATFSDHKHHLRLVAAIEEGFGNKRINACPADFVDYMPCEDPKRSSRLSREMNLYRERRYPLPQESLLCLILPPPEYKVPVRWPQSLHKGWMKKEGQHFIFPGGGTMFPDGAVQYIEKLGQYIPISGGVLRTALDMGCGIRCFHPILLTSPWFT